MFNLAEESIAAYPGLEGIIVSRIPRFDSISNDPPQIKSILSQYGNSLYRNVWMDRGCPTNTEIHDFWMDCYGIPGTRGFDGKFVDGIHIRGILAVKHYTDSFVRILRPANTWQVEVL